LRVLNASIRWSHKSANSALPLNLSFLVTKSWKSSSTIRISSLRSWTVCCRPERVSVVRRSSSSFCSLLCYSAEYSVSNQIIFMSATLSLLWMMLVANSTDRRFTSSFDTWTVESSVLLANVHRQKKLPKSSPSAPVANFGRPNFRFQLW
jgi:hypothetical protein